MSSFAVAASAGKAHHSSPALDVAPASERVPLLQPSSWSGFGAAAFTARRGRPAPQLPSIFVTPPTPPLPGPTTSSPVRHLAAQTYAALGAHLGGFASCAAYVDPRGTQYPYLLAGAGVALVAAATLVRANAGAKLAWSPGLSVLLAANGAALGASAAPLRCLARLRHKHWAGPSAHARACPPRGPEVAISLAAGVLTSALLCAAQCAHWRRATARLRVGAHVPANPEGTYACAAVAAVFFGLGLLATTTGLLADDAAFTLLGCSALLAAPATLVPALLDGGAPG